MRIWVVAVVVAGCYRPVPPAGAPCSLVGDCPSGLACVGGFCGGDTAADDAPLVDDASDARAATDGAPVDGRPLDTPGCQSFSTQFETCGMTFAVDFAVSGAMTYDTDTHVFSGNTGVAGMLVAAGAGQVDVVAVRSFTIPAGATLTVTGSHPFAIAASTQIAIIGALDLVGGAGARSTCSAGNGTASTSGGSGGGGGGFRGGGGAGGIGVSAAGGMPGGVQQLPLGPLGGCAGGNGGAGSSPGMASGGMGGGAVYLVAAQSITIGGSVDAGGVGGTPSATSFGGGGGGGSGGMILLEAPAVSVAGALAANGGGGAGGGGILPAGKAGDSGTATATAAAGGASGITATAGGSGSAGTTLAGTAVTATPLGGGGGGGGGGAGFIAIASPSPSVVGVVSPPLSTWP